MLHINTYQLSGRVLPTKSGKNNYSTKPAPTKVFPMNGKMVSAKKLGSYSANYEPKAVI